MQVYVANCTHQNQQLNYRLPEYKKMFTLRLPMGRQGLVGDKEGLNQLQVNSFVEQMSPYGLVSVDELNGDHGAIPYVFSIDRPVRSDVIVRVVQHNSGVLRADGKKRRIEAAMAITEAAGAAGPLKELEASIEQISDGNMTVEERVEEGFIMTKNAGGNNPRGKVKNTTVGRRKAGA